MTGTNRPIPVLIAALRGWLLLPWESRADPSAALATLERVADSWHELRIALAHLASNDAFADVPDGTDLDLDSARTALAHAEGDEL